MPSCQALIRPTCAGSSPGRSFGGAGFVLQCLCWVIGGGIVAAEETTAPSWRPNFLVLLADDQRSDAARALGNPAIDTPNIDLLVRRGFRFRNAYCMGSLQGAVCVPSRAMFHTGRSLFHVREDMRGAPLMGETLRRAGYVTFGTGKWHNGPEAFLRAFDRGSAIFFGGMADHTRVPLVDLAPGGRLVNRRVGAAFSSTLFADAAIDFLTELQGDAPFFLYVAFTAPHDPRQVPPGYEGKYPPDSVTLPGNFRAQHPFDNGWLTVRDEMLAPWPRTEQILREQIADYQALISHLDHEIGRILEALDSTGRAERTIVVYASDHGLALGSHGLLGKQNLYEHSMKAPLVFAGPGIPAGGASDKLVYLFDVFPTLCAFAEIPPPSGLDGQVLTGLWRNPRNSGRETIFTVMGGEMRAVRDARWKLIRYPQIDRWQLFDLRDDPAEVHDLSANPSRRAQLASMQRRLLAAQRFHGDVLPLWVANPAPAGIDLSAHPRRPDPHQPPSILRKYFPPE